MHPNILQTVQVDVCEAECRFLRRNVVALRQDCPPWIHDLSHSDISESEAKEGEAMTMQSTVSLKGVDNSSRTSVP